LLIVEIKFHGRFLFLCNAHHAILLAYLKVEHKEKHT